MIIFFYLNLIICLLLYKHNFEFRKIYAQKNIVTMHGMDWWHYYPTKLHYNKCLLLQLQYICTCTIMCSKLNISNQRRAEHSINWTYQTHSNPVMWLDSIGFGNQMKSWQTLTRIHQSNLWLGMIDRNCQKLSTNNYCMRQTQ